jgi:hypothetical protein
MTAAWSRSEIRSADLKGGRASGLPIFAERSTGWLNLIDEVVDCHRAKRGDVVERLSGTAARIVMPPGEHAKSYIASKSLSDPCG